jgi:hypothetical protein
VDVSRKRRSLIGNGTGPSSLVPDVEPPDDESSVRTEPFRPDWEEDAKSLSGRFDTPPGTERSEEDPGPAVAEPPVAVPAATTPPPPTAAASLPPNLQDKGGWHEKDSWFVSTGAPAPSREGDVDTPMVSGPGVPGLNPQSWVMGLLAAVAVGVTVLLLVYVFVG